MSKKKDVVKGEGHVARIRENSRLMRTHETMVDFISGRHPGRSILDVFASGLFASDFLHSFDANLEDDIIYSDEDEEDDDDDDDRLYSQNSAHKPLEPHPRIRQLTDEEADKHAKELLEEEERRKERTEKNKRKKMRKKAKKRLEKENAVKDILPEEERAKSDSDNKEENKSECDETQNTTEKVKHEEEEEEEQQQQQQQQQQHVKTNEKEDEEPKDLDFNNSRVSLAEPEESSKQRPARARRKETSKLMKVQQPKDVETAETQEKDEEREAETETGTEPAAEDVTKRSRELAGVGNRLAASGQYELAVKYFTDAIRYNPTEFKLFGNRSLCYERTQQYESALRDAELALCMEPSWIKGLFRKGKALCGLKRYYEASLIYREVLQLESGSTEAMQELKRAQTLHLMEMGFSWAQSSEALRTHATLEAAVEALFGDLNLSPAVDAAACKDVTEPPAVQDEGGGGDGDWIVRQTSRPRMQQVREADDPGQSRSKSQSPTPPLRNPVRVELFPVWVGSLAPAVTYTTLHELFSRAGTVFSIKMLLEHQCAFVNYARKEDCDRAITASTYGMVVEGAPLSVRFPNKIHNGLGMSKMAATDFGMRPGSYKKECFFWRTTGCTRSDCTYKHVPEHKNIDRDKFTSRLGNINM